MAKRKEEESFTVSDRRLFSTDGELRPEADSAADRTNEGGVRLIADDPQPTTVAGIEAVSAEAEPPADTPPPSPEQQSAQADAYQQTNRSMDEAIGKEMGAGVSDLACRASAGRAPRSPRVGQTQ